MHQLVQRSQIWLTHRCIDRRATKPSLAIMLRPVEADVEFMLEVAHAAQNMWAYEEIVDLKGQLERENIYLQGAA